MNFNDLMAKMRELDQPATEAIIQDTAVEECGEPMGMSTPSTPSVPEPSMSLNLNAQGMDNIEQLMKLMTKVNPDMINQKGPEAAFPTISPEKSITSIAPLKMLPDLDKEDEGVMGAALGALATKSPAGAMAGSDIEDKLKGDDEEKDEATDRRDAYQRDFDSSQTGFGKPEREDDEGEDEQDEAFGNAPTDASEPYTYDLDAAIPDGNDLNKPKKSFSGKPYRGDNPMAASAFESTDLRAQIKAELAQRLAEAKGAK